MITHFSVKNFRCFRDWSHFDLRTQKRYEFNPESIVGTTIKNAVLYGENGQGKTNIGLAMMDVIYHLSQKHISIYKSESSFLNIYSGDSLAEFCLCFDFNGAEVIYEYGKNEKEKVVYENLRIDGDLILSLDKKQSMTAIINLNGAETLNKVITENIPSVVSYVRNNVAKEDSRVHQVFWKFCQFVDGMAFVGSRDIVREFFGPIPQDYESLDEAIIYKYGVSTLETFLTEMGITMKLTTMESEKGKTLGIQGLRRTIPFFSNISSGTRSLTILFLWIQRIKHEQLSFIFFDEFDAHYHHALARDMMRALFATQAQVVITSHNTSVISTELLRPDCYFQVNDYQPKPFYKFTERELREAHNMEKMYRAGVFS